MIQRTTELRHLEANQVHEISLILDDNDGWKHIMSSIPKLYDAASCSTDGSVDWDRLADEVGYKYNSDQIRKISTPRQGDSRLPAQIFINEWSTSGRKENRPTVGVFLQLLVKAQLFRAADLVAEKWLGEPTPKRPTEGPAAKVNVSLPSAFLNEVASYANDTSFQPVTDDLIVENALRTNGRLENNKDFYTKFHFDEKNLNAHDNTPPIIPPRKNRKPDRMQSQEQVSPKHQSSTNAAATTATMNGSINGEHEKTSATVNGETTEAPEIHAAQQLPLLPVFFSNLESDNIVTSNEIHTDSTSIENYNAASLPLLSVLQEPVKSDATMTDINNLPLISALNLNGEQQHDNVVEHSEIHNQENQLNGLCSNELDDDDSNDDSKLGSSNNDSSLTNVTGTSGENSFELSSRSTSNENIPVNVLQY